VTLTRGSRLWALGLLVLGLSTAGVTEARAAFTGVGVTNLIGGTVQFFDFAGNPNGTLASGHLLNPRGIAQDTAGNIFVNDIGNSSIQEFNGTTGAFITQVVAGPPLSFPHEMAFGPNGSLYVSNFAGNNIVTVTGGVASVFPTTPAGSIAGPTGLAFDSLGNLWVANSTSGIINEYNSTTGALIQQVSSGLINQPSGISFGPNGDLYIANFANNNILVYDFTSKVVSVFATGNGLNGPADVRFASDGDVYVANQTGNNILRFIPAANGLTGSFDKIFASGLSAPTYLLTGRPVPEPSSLALAAFGVCGLAGMVVRRRNRTAV
jgi:streptogramin lyase